MKSIPTAEDILYKNILNSINNENRIPIEHRESTAKILSGYGYEEKHKWQKNSMIEFAQLHVKAALEKVSKIDPITGPENCCEIDKESILNAYPIENIK